MKNTSIQARSEKIKSGTIQTDRAKIYKTLKSWPNSTYRQIAARLGWSNPNKVSRRLLEMVRTGIIEESGVKVCPIAKRKCTYYSIK